MADPSTAFIPDIPRRTPLQRLCAKVRSRSARRILNHLLWRKFATAIPFEVKGDPSLRIRRQSDGLHVVAHRPGILGPTVCAMNRDLAIEVCEQAAIRYFVVPEAGTMRFRIGVDGEGWDKFVDALLARGRKEPVYVGVIARNTAGVLRRWSALSLDPRAARAVREQHSIEVFTDVEATEAGRRFGRANACLVDKWVSDPDGTLVAPVRNTRTTRIGAAYQDRVAIVQAGREVQTLSALAGRGVFDIDFPIDVVYMWVDGSDAEWQARMRAAWTREGRANSITATSIDRFREAGELRYSMRSVERHLSWVRRIFLVTDDQIPSWLDRSHPSINLVSHRELFKACGPMSSFNSHAIGARLHHIEGLAEHYLVFNDDIFAGRDLDASLFFEANGVSKFFLSRSTLPFPDPSTAPEHENARRNSVNLLARDFNRTPSNAFFHTAIPQRKSIMLDLEERYPEQFKVTWQSLFRSSNDYEFNCWLHHYYGYLEGRAVRGSARYDYFDVALRDSWRRMGRLRRAHNMDMFCINDSPNATDEQRLRAMSWLDEYFSGKSSYEL